MPSMRADYPSWFPTSTPPLDSRTPRPAGDGGMLAAAAVTMTNQQQEAVVPSALQPSLPNTDKRLSDPTTEVPPAAHVRAIGVELTEDDHTYIRRKLRKLGKFATSIQRVSVRVTDLNGPRGGVDQVCSIKVVLSGLPSVVVTRQHVAVHAAIDAALHAIEQAVRGRLGRRRMKPLRYRSTQAHVGRF